MKIKFISFDGFFDVENKDELEFIEWITEDYNFGSGSIVSKNCFSCIKIKEQTENFNYCLELLEKHKKKYSVRGKKFYNFIDVETGKVTEYDYRYEYTKNGWKRNIE